MSRLLVAWGVIALGAIALFPASARAEDGGPPAHRRITHHLIDELAAGTVSPPLDRHAPLSCLGAQVHAPWQNPFSPLPSSLRERHVRMTLAAAEAVVEYRDTFLIEAPRTLAYDVTPLDDARLELGYRLFGCNGGQSDVTLHVRVSDATGTWEESVPLELDRPKRTSREAFREVLVDLPLAPGLPAHLELTLTPDRPSGNGVLVALAEPVLTGVEPGPATRADTNVLWIVIDSVRTDAMGPSRAFEPSATPEMDRRIFARGTGFTQAYSMSNQTRTSTLAMIGSVAPSIGGFHSHAWAFTAGRRETFYAKDPPLLTRELSAAGFRVAHFGNNHFLWNSEVVGLDNGFPRAVDFRGIPSDAVLASEEANKFFDRHQDERWFLMLNYTAPHTPYKPPPEYGEKAAETPFAAAPGKTLPVVKAHPEEARDERAERGDGVTRRRRGPATRATPEVSRPGLAHRVGFLPRNYLGELMWVDHNLESVFAHLEELGLLDDTLVIVTADHGEVMNPAHDCASAVVKLNCSFNHSVTVYDDELNVPLGMALPGRIAAGRTITTPVSHADLPPTILDVLGLPLSPRQAGRSLVSALAGGPVAERPIYADGRLASALRVGQWKLIVHAAQDDIRPRSRLIGGENQKYEVFDLVADPLETVNLAVARKDVLEMLTAELKTLRLDMHTRFERLAPWASEVAQGLAPSDGPSAKNRLMLVTDASPHRLTGRIASAGALRCPDSAAPNAELGCSPDGEGAVSVDLAAPANASVVIELTSRPWDAALSFELMLDGRPVPADRLRLGPWGVCLLPVGAALDTSEHLALAVSSRAPLPQPHETAVYFWRSADPGSGHGEAPAPLVAEPASPEDTVPDPHADEQLGGQVKKMLKDLGYTH